MVEVLTAVPRTCGMVGAVSGMAVCTETGLQIATAVCMVVAVVVAQITRQLNPAVPVACHSATVAPSTPTTRIERGRISLSGLTSLAPEVAGLRIGREL